MAIRIRRFSEALSEEGLIRFDRKAVVLLGISVVVFLILVFFKIHTSSIPIWNQIIPEEKLQTVIGTPKGVRSDEWVVTTPFMLSQYEKGYPVSNEALGGGSVPLLTNIPVKHISTVFRSQFWGYFFLDIERAFSFFWNFKYLVLFLGIFILLMLLTANNFWLSLFGSVVTLFSSFVQWWFSINIPEMIGFFAISLSAFIYLLYSRKSHLIIGAWFMLLFSGINFLLFFYPPFQVILVYLGLAILIGYSAKFKSLEEIRYKFRLKFFLFILFALLSVATLVIFYTDSRETMRLIMDTVYPGQRRSTGGGISFYKYFSGFINPIMTENYFPRKLLNASEASNFILFFPVSFLSLILLKIKKNKLDPIILSLAVYIVMVTLYVTAGYPGFFAKVTLTEFTTTERAILGIGLASVFVTIVFLADKKMPKLGLKWSSVVALSSFVMMIFMVLYVKKYTETFIGTRFRYLILLSFIMAFCYFFLAMKRNKTFVALFSIIIASAMIINPISAGLFPLFGKDLSVIIKDENKKQAKWAVYGSRLIPPFFVANGADVIDGVKYVPDFKTIDVLDPEKKFNTVYNRYAHTTLSQPVDNQEVNFKLIYADLYTIYISPCSPKLKQVGVTRLAFSQEELPNEASLKCLVPLAKNPVNSVYLYEYR